jgi:hypothetical protein
VPEIKVYAKDGQQVVIERGNLGKVVLELHEVKQVMSELPKALAQAERGLTEAERQRQIKEHEDALAKLKATQTLGGPPLHQTKEGAGKLGQNKEKS